MITLSHRGDEMRKVNLRMKELNKYEVIKELVDHGGNKKRAAQKLGLTIRQINRLIKIYTVSYTNLRLPTNREVLISVVAVSL